MSFPEYTHSPLIAPTFLLFLCLWFRKTSPSRPSPMTLSSTFSSRVLFFHKSLPAYLFVHANSALSNSFLLKLLSLVDKALQELAIMECLLCARQCIKPFICMISVNPQYISMSRIACLWEHSKTLRKATSVSWLSYIHKGMCCFCPGAFQEASGKMAVPRDGSSQKRECRSGQHLLSSAFCISYNSSTTTNKLYTHWSSNSTNIYWVPTLEFIFYSLFWWRK